MSNWTHPVCSRCWRAFGVGYAVADQKHTDAEHLKLHPEPVRIREPDTEVCALCQHPTRSGIFMRIDPELVEWVHELNAHTQLTD